MCVCVCGVCIVFELLPGRPVQVVYKSRTYSRGVNSIGELLKCLSVRVFDKDLGPEGKRLVWKYHSPSSLVPKSLGLE